ncbi:MAG TPA: ComEC/Rec2 family competence protein, partial [Candidatus Rifleibacterium sp.]|nr:ComEC/Rec2 family competence protein [Candidatus Rifleibacterium sp.]
ETMPEPEQSYSLTGHFSVGSPGVPPVFHGKTLENITGNLSVSNLTGKIQRKLRDSLHSVLPARHAGIVIGLILGDTSQISLEDRVLFRETGVSHILAVSGQHIMVLIIFLAAILHWFRVPPLSRSVMIAVFLLIYSMTTVGSPSVWRAFIMYICVVAVLHLEASPSPTRPVAIAAFLLLLANPQLVGNAAFQLSFTAVISIIFLRVPIEETLKRWFFPAPLARYFAVSMAAGFGTMPLTAMLFGTVSTAALLVNPLIIWSFSYILPVAFITALLAIFWPSASIIIAPGLSLVLDGMLGLMSRFQAIPGQFFYVGNLPGVLIAVLYAGMLLLAARSNQKRFAAALIKSETKKTAPEKAPGIEAPPVAQLQNISKTIASDKPPAPAAAPKAANPFRHAPTLAAMDEMLCEFRRKPLKNLKSVENALIPLHLLSIDSQNLYHQIIDLDRQTFNSEPERLLQSHILLMALTGNEILNRISAHLNPPPQPGEIRIGQPVKDRNLATAILAELVLHSAILSRSRSENFMMLISRGQTVFYRARRQLERILAGENFSESIEQHFTLRQDMLAWCREFIDFDNQSRQAQNSRIRPEQ